MTENGLPCLDLLEATPGILRALMTELTDADARARKYQTGAGAMAAAYNLKP
jgi:hypothetical protein